MMEQAEICLRIGLPLGLGVDSQLGKGEFASLPPQLDCGLNFWSPEKIGLLGSLRRFRHHGSGAVHVIAPNLVFGTIAAVSTCQCLKRPKHAEGPTIAGMSHHSEYVSSCKSCSPFGTSCDCASRGHRLVQPLNKWEFEGV